MYKLACGTRSDREVYDLMGPWYIDGTSWPDLHWDLNVQLTYYPLYAANRLDIAESLKKLMDNNIQVCDTLNIIVICSGLCLLMVCLGEVFPTAVCGLCLIAFDCDMNDAVLFVL